MIFMTITWGPTKWQTSKMHKMAKAIKPGFWFHKRENENLKFLLSCDSPRHLKTNTPAIIDVNPVREGRTRVYYITTLLCNLPDIITSSTHNKTITSSTQRGENESIKNNYPMNLPDTQLIK